MKILKIVASVMMTLIIAINLQQAISYYNIGHISLPDQFYWQSINDVVIDNRGDKKQSVTIGSSARLRAESLTANDKGKLLFVTVRDSYHVVW